MIFFKCQGSISNPNDGQVVARAALSTLIACCVGGGVVLFIAKALPGGHWSLSKVSPGKHRRTQGGGMAVFPRPRNSGGLGV